MSEEKLSFRAELERLEANPGPSNHIERREATTTGLTAESNPRLATRPPDARCSEESETLLTQVKSNSEAHSTGGAGDRDDVNEL